MSGALMSGVGISIYNSFQYGIFTLGSELRPIRNQDEAKKSLKT